VDPAKHDFTMQRGTYGTRGAVVLQFCEADGVTPLPLTDAVVVLQTTNLAPPIAKSTLDGTLTIDQSTSQVTWLPTSDEINSIPLGRWTKYLIEISYSNGSGLRFMEGYLIGRGA
jgi:hypothetical protein